MKETILLLEAVAAAGALGLPMPAFGKVKGERGFANFSRNTEGIGRNDPCPCGSGKKFKKCCKVVGKEKEPA